MGLKTKARRLGSRVAGAAYYLCHGRLPDSAAKGQRSWILGMTTPEEQSYYVEAAYGLAGRAGAMVDLGCWLGSTSISLAQGLTRAGVASVPLPGRKIYAYDLFRWESWMDEFLPRVSCDYRPGDSFLPEVRRRIRDFDALIELIPADLTQYEWCSGPIKLLLVDAMKSPQLAQSITGAFYPHLLPDSLLIHQDYKHYWTPWIHLIQYRLRPYFKFSHNVLRSGTVAFQTRKTIDPESARLAVDFARVNQAEVDAAMDFSMRLVDREGQVSIAAAHVTYYAQLRQKAVASRVLERYRSQGLSANADFDLAAKYLAQLDA